MKNCWHHLCYIGDGLAVPFRTHHTIITTAQTGETAKLLAIVYYLSPWKQMCQAQFDLDGYLNANGPLYICSRSNGHVDVYSNFIYGKLFTC